MKNIFKLLSLCVIITIFTVFGFNVQAKTDSITIKKVQIMPRLVSNYKQDIKIYKTENDKFVYNLEFDKKALKKNKKLTFKENADSGLLYILENGYPKKKITGITKTDKFITETAIWLYLDDTEQGKSVDAILRKENNKKDTYNIVSTYIKPLVQKALEAKENNYSTKKPTMEIDDNYMLSLSKNKKYFESNYISVALTGSKTYTVSSDFIILDENNEIKNKFNAKDKFKVRIPVSEMPENNQLTITIKATGKENVAKIYEPKNDEYQSVVGLFTKNHKLSKKINLTAATATTCKYMDGNYHDKAGNITDKETYLNECNNICKIINENYYGIDGEETSKLIFDKKCKKACTKEDNVFYGIDSRKVDIDTFYKECKISSSVKSQNDTSKAIKDDTKDVTEEKSTKNETVNKQNNEATLVEDVPNTQSDISPISILFGSLFVLCGLGVLYKRNKAIN